MLVDCFIQRESGFRKANEDRVWPSRTRRVRLPYRMRRITRGREVPVRQAYRSGALVKDQTDHQVPLRAAFRRSWAPVDGACGSSSGRIVVGLFDATDWLDWLPEATLLLHGSERARVARLRNAALRDTRIQAYALHRLLLGQVLGVDPTRVRLYRDSLGCPRVVGDQVWTSLSHADHAIAVAVSVDGPVGIDIELKQRCHAMADIAERVCHPDELARVAGWPHQDTDVDLLELWVAKEALLKAAGIGLELEMDRFAIDAAQDCKALGRARHLPVRLLDVGDEWVAAVAGAPGARLFGGWIDPAADRPRVHSKLVTRPWGRPAGEASRVQISEPLTRVS
jgi:4'-phosphopantetheinyl transferase